VLVYKERIVFLRGPFQVCLFKLLQPLTAELLNLWKGLCSFPDFPLVVFFDDFQGIEPVKFQGSSQLSLQLNRLFLRSDFLRLPDVLVRNSQVP
jgi:hypothetical protein